MPMFRPTPRDVDAFHYDGTNADALKAWIGKDFGHIHTHSSGAVTVYHTEGNFKAKVGDGIVRDLQGWRFSVIDKDVFARDWRPAGGED